MDVKTIIKSVKKTGKILVVNEAVKSHSVSAEIIALVNELAFYNLKAAPARVTGWDITVPWAQGEKYFIVTPEQIIEKALELINTKE